MVAPGTCHSAIVSDFSGCALRAFVRFVQLRPVPSGCRARRPFRPLPPPPRRLADVPRLAGAPGERGRTLAAVQMTLRDVAQDSLTELIFDPDDPDIARGGGLRRGHYRLDGDNTLVMQRVSFVPGVTLTGRIEGFATRVQRGRLRVGGSAAPPGRLALRGEHVSGSLGGRRVSAALDGPSAAVALAAQRDDRPLAR